MAARARHNRMISQLNVFRCLTYVQFFLILILFASRPATIPETTSSLDEQPKQPSKSSSKSDYTFISTPTLDRKVEPRTDSIYRPKHAYGEPTLCAGKALFSNREGETTLEVPDEELESAFQVLVARYLAPWTPITSNTAVLERPITQKLLNSMEVLLRGGAFRVRLAGDGKVRYRVLEHWGQTYRISRMTWTLNVLQKAMEEYSELAAVKCEFYVNVADSPRSTLDSMSRDMGGIPVFSFRTGTAYLDVPVPDPVEYGSNGNYVWKAETNLPFNERIPKLVFRGSASSLQEYHDDNWLSVPRLRLAALTRERPDLFEAGITKWMKLVKGATIDEVEKSLGINVVRQMDFEEQGKYQFVADIDGGLGSSRKRGILTSGSVPFFQKSTWYMWYEPLLKPFYHFLPIETYLQDLTETVENARSDPEESKRIIERANCFGENVVSEKAAGLFWKTLLMRYSQLQYDPASDGADVEPSMCSLRPATAEGPMGCDNGWYVYNGSVPFGCKFKGAKEQHPYQFECWRNIGNGTEFKFTSDPVHSFYHQDG